MQTNNKLLPDSNKLMSGKLPALVLGLLALFLSGSISADNFKGKKMPPYPADFNSLDERLTKDQKKVILWVMTGGKHQLWIADVHKLVDNKPPEMTIRATLEIPELAQAGKGKLELILFGCGTKGAKEDTTATIVMVDPGQKEMKSAIKKAWLADFSANSIKTVATANVNCDTSDAPGGAKDDKSAVKENPKVMACGKKEINANDTLEIRFPAAKTAKAGLTVLSPKGELFLLVYPPSEENGGKNFKPLMEHSKFIDAKAISIKIKDTTAPFFSEQSEQLAGNKKVFTDKGDYLFVLGEAESETGGVSCVVSLK
jgi:hypothetical protein